MHDKMDIYDLLGTLIPGVLVVSLAPLAFPAMTEQLKSLAFPDAFAVLALTAASVLVGLLVQASASVLEPMLHRTWGGRPSEVALSRGLGDRYFSAQDGTRIRNQLTRLADAHASNQSLFLIAMQLAESGEAGKARRFNALYAYHRSLLTMMLVVCAAFVISSISGPASGLGWLDWCVTCAFLFGTMVLLWHRTRQRSYYYVREVLLSAERILRSTASS